MFLVFMSFYRMVSWHPIIKIFIAVIIWYHGAIWKSDQTGVSRKTVSW